MILAVSVARMRSVWMITSNFFPCSFKDCPALFACSLHFSVRSGLSVPSLILHAKFDVLSACLVNHTSVSFFPQLSIFAYVVKKL